MPRHIVICFHDFPIGGTERVAIDLARRWVASGWQVTILCGTEVGPQRELVDPSVAVVSLDPPLPRSPISRFALARRMAERLPALAPDAIFLPGNFHLVLAPALSRALPNTPIIGKISNPLSPAGILGAPVRWLLRSILPNLSGAAAMNSGLAREVAALSPRIAVRTLYDPIAVKSPSAPHSRHHGAAKVVWAGRFEPQKDVPLALAVAQEMARRRPFHLTMLGGGAGLERARAEVARRGLTQNITLAGHVPAIDPWLGEADALLVTSRYEGGPAVAVEALAHGVPVVSTDCSHFLRDVMTLPEAGRIVPSRDPATLAAALEAVLDAPRPDPARLAPLLAPLEPDRCARAYADFFAELIAARSA